MEIFRLRKLLEDDDIVIQCHNIPDADTIASAFAVYTYLKANNKEVRLIYSGSLEITKTNLLEMIIKLSIPLEYVRKMNHVKTLVLVDCQYGEKNVEKFSADKVIVIDHHQHDEAKSGYPAGIIHSQLGSCATLVWDLLRKEQFDFMKYPDVSTALYYGLYTDTSNLEEIAHPLDKDARDSLKFDPHIVKRLRNNNLNLSELTIAGNALTQYEFIHNLGFAIFRTEQCDPNILGFISDIALQVNSIELCVVYNTLPDGFKLSVRSCARAVMANDFAQYLTQNVGSAGGHLAKAGGFINKSKLDDLSVDIEEYIEKRTREYFSSYETIDAANHNLDVSVMGKYKKRKIPVGYAVSTDIFEKGTPMLIRTLEGDAEVEASGEIYLMIGILGEVYPIKAEKFNRSYSITNTATAVMNENFSYSPTVRNKITGDFVELIKFAKTCVAMGEAHIYAMPLAKNTKVFTAWNTEGYMYGKAGDFLALRADDHNDIYILRQDIFVKTYEPQ